MLSSRRSFLMLWVCPLQGRDILKELEELPSRNVSVRVVTSVPSVRTNSTDLNILKGKGVEAAPLLCIVLICSPRLPLTALPSLAACRSSGEEGELRAPDEGSPPQQVLDSWRKTCVYWKCQHGLEGSHAGNASNMWWRMLILHLEGPPNHFTMRM